MLKSGLYEKVISRALGEELDASADKLSQTAPMRPPCTLQRKIFSQKQKHFHLFQNFPQFIVTPTVKGFGIVNKAEIDVFLELSCFFDYPEDVGNLISGSSAFSKTSLNIRKFTVHVLLKPSLENFEHYFGHVWMSAIVR